MSTAEKVIDNIVKIIRITLPKELVGKFVHRDYLSAVMKFGLNRDRMGDILIYENGADILVLKENAEYLKNSLQELTRFKKSKIEIVNITQIKNEEKHYQDIKITISSNRLDNFISEIAKISRSKTDEILNEERVKINSKVETKPSKEIYLKDEIIIRGYGKYIVDEFLGSNKKGKTIVLIKKLN